MLHYYTIISAFSICPVWTLCIMSLYIQKCTIPVVRVPPPPSPLHAPALCVLFLTMWHMCHVYAQVLCIVADTVVPCLCSMKVPCALILKPSDATCHAVLCLCCALLGAFAKLSLVVNNSIVTLTTTQFLGHQMETKILHSKHTQHHLVSLDITFVPKHMPGFQGYTRKIWHGTMKSLEWVIEMRPSCLCLHVKVLRV